MYRIKQINKSKEYLEIGECFDIKYEKVQFVSEYHSDLEYPWIEEECYYIQRIKKNNQCKKSNGDEVKKTDENTNSNIYGKKICVLIIKVSNSTNNIIFSHGNSSTIGTMYPYLLDMATQLKVNDLIFFII